MKITVKQIRDLIEGAVNDRSKGWDRNKERNRAERNARRRKPGKPFKKGVNPFTKQPIKEVGMSPSLKQNKPLEGPFDNKNVGVSLEKLQAAFEQALSLDLIVRSMDEHYNEETREFDDGVYDEIKNIVNSSREKATQAIKQGLIGAWDAAHNDRQAQPASGVHPVAKKAA